MTLTRKKPLLPGRKGLARKEFSKKPVARRGDDRPSGEAGMCREHLLNERAERQLASAKATAGMAMPSRVVPGAASTGIVLEKDNAMCSEPYRRLVAALPCIYCGIVGFSQHAHANQGKGLGLKVDDRRGFPLCCSRPGVEGCHVAFDQYHLLQGGRDAHRAAAERWAQLTRAVILKSGRWPKKLPTWKGDDHGNA